MKRHDGNIEPWEIDQVLLYGDKWPTFTDAKHPLNPDDTPGAAPRRVVLDSIKRRLGNELKASGISKTAWAKAAGKSKDQPNRWLEHPEKMDAETVGRTCELFGVTPDYLRNATPTPGGESEQYDGELVGAIYERLNDRHKRMVTDLVRELASEEAEAERLGEMARAVEKLVERGIL